MAKYTETIDLYDDVGKLLKSGVALDKISPVTNPGIGKIIDLTKRTVAVNLAGLEAALASGKVGGKFNPVSYTHLRAHETDSYLVCRLLLEKKKKSPDR